jgi:hypothetical protein
MSDNQRNYGQKKKNPNSNMHYVQNIDIYNKDSGVDKRFEIEDEITQDSVTSRPRLKIRKMGSLFNPNSVDPRKVIAPSKPAGVSTNYGIQNAPMIE